ncbi:MAG: AMP-binding protein [Tateyamaria sp.]|uniref:AMP-binding protein n=1 Tax=Tateyamaria sp. TaxID=1929288 RepID=UPI00328D45DB
MEHSPRTKVTQTRLDLAIARHTGEAVALVDGDRTLSYHALEQHVRSTKAWITTLVRPDELIGIYIDNSLEAVVAILAAMRAGIAAVPINTKNDASTVDFIAQNAGAGAILASKIGLRRIGEADLGVAVHLFELTQTPSEEESTGPQIGAGLPDTALVFFTSGSTGKPKGVCVSHDNLVHGADSVARYLNVQAEERIAAVLPVSFDAGLNWVLTGLACGAEIHLLKFIFPRSLAADLGKHEIRALLAVPSVFHALSEAPASQGSEGIRMASTGGRMDAPIVNALRSTYRDLKFTVMYGLTEAFRATYLPDYQWTQAPHSIGHPIPHAEISIMRDDGTQADMGETGEIIQSGPLVSKGYINSPRQQRLRFGPTPLWSTWKETHPISVYSGDQGFVGDDGFIYFAGRKDRLIKSRGFRISPEELEKAIVSHAGIDHIVCFGEDDVSVGQRIVVVAEGRENKHSTLNSLRLALRGHVPDYMLPDALRWLATFPLSANGKFDVKRIIEMTKS